MTASDTPGREELEQLPKEILAAWRSRFPNNMYARPGAPEDFAIEAVKVFAARLAAKPADDGVTDAMIRAYAEALDPNGELVKGSFLWNEIKHGLKAALSTKAPKPHKGD